MLDVSHGFTGQMGRYKKNVAVRILSRIPGDVEEGEETEQQ